jgi:hypothetical protein
VDHLTQVPPDMPLDRGAGYEHDGLSRVYGVVSDALGHLVDALVEAYDRDLANDQLLGAAQAHAGRYEIWYDAGQLRNAEKGGADLVMRIRDAQGRARYESSIRFNADADLEWNLVLDGATYRGLSEWEVLTPALTPPEDHVPSADVRDDL